MTRKAFSLSFVCSAAVCLPGAVIAADAMIAPIGRQRNVLRCQLFQVGMAAIQLVRRLLGKSLSVYRRARCRARIEALIAPGCRSKRSLSFRAPRNCHTTGHFYRLGARRFLEFPEGSAPSIACSGGNGF